MALNYKRLVEGFQHDTAKAKAGVREAFAAKAIQPRDVDLSRLWVECFGWHEFAACRGDQQRSAVKVMEAAGGVSLDAFSTISQQFIYATVLDAWDAPDLVFSKLIPTRDSKFVYERIPGVSNIGDEALVVDEGNDFPLAGVTEDYVETPETKKRGVIIPITREAIFFERTGLVSQRAQDVGTWLGVNKEKRAIDCVIDAGETKDNQYRYKWRGVSTNAAVVSIATYGDSSGDHNWDNLAASNPLTDYESFNAAWQLLLAMTDPYTGEPIGDKLTPKHVWFPPSLAFKYPFTVGGMVRRANPGYATSGNPTVTELDNPVAKIVGQLTPVSSQLLQARMTAASKPANTWWVGDITKMFAYMQNWPMAVTQLGAGSQDEFKRDIVQQYKASERGTFATLQPRAGVENRA